MKKIRLLMASLAIMLAILPARGWTPSENYADWLTAFSIDKMWQPTSATLDTVDYPGVISWSILVYRQVKATDNANYFNYADVYIFNVNNTSDEVQLCRINCVNLQISNIVNYQSNTTLKVLEETNDQSFFRTNRAYFVTSYSDSIRNLLSRANNNVGVKVHVRWKSNETGTSFTYYTERSSLQESDRSIIPNPQQPSISNVEWTLVNGNTTQLSFKHGLTTSGLDFYVVEDRTNQTSGISYTAGANNTSLYRPVNIDNFIIYAHDYQNPKFKYRAYTKKSYTYSATSLPSTITSIAPTTKTLKSVETVFYPPAFAQPTYISATDEKDGRVKLTWYNNQHTAGAPYDNCGFVIERSTNSSFSTIDTTYTVPFNYQTGSGTTSYTYYDSFTEREVGGKTFYYRIRREHSALRKTASVTVNTNWARLSRFTAGVNPSSTTQIKLEWDYEAGIKNNDLKVRITYNTQEIIVASHNGTKSQIITGIASCTPTAFTAQMQVNQQNLGNSKSSTATLPLSDPGVIDTVMASAGYYDNRVNVNWKVNSSYPNFSSFDLVRMEYGDTTREILSTITFSGGSLQYSYNDNTCIPGVYYEYKVIGYSSCNGKASQSAEKSAIGFAQPYGVVSGQIAYSGNQAVKDVAVVAEGVGQFNGRSVSLLASDQPKLEIPADFVDDMLSNNGGTIEFFVRIDDETSYDNFIIKYGNLALLHRDRQLVLQYDESGYVNSIYADSALSSGSFAHIALTLQKCSVEGLDYPIMDIKLYKNGNWIASYASLTGITAVNIHSPIIFGHNSNYYMTGNFDEIRIWNTVRTREEIKRYSDTYLTGSETGLTGYYRCDDEIGRTLFDLSKTGNNFNGRHIAMSGVTMDENNIPTVEQLSHKAYTDVNGNYLFNSIPYSTNGSLYNIIPMLGIHEFSPSQRPLFFNASANTHNAVDFEDISSFPVSGKVTFDNTDYPVKGCQFYIDGTTLCTNDGEPIETDEEGNYSISVPIGQHYITVKKNGHTFVNGGRYPTTGKVEFQNAVTNLTFKDSTFVLLTGRVSGGNDEANKPHGHGRGVATIGQAKITLGTLGDRNLNLDENNGRTFTMPADSVHGTCNSVATTGRAYQSLAQEITIWTDPATGEFNVMLPPVDFEVKSIEIPGNQNLSFNLSSIGNIPLGTQDVNTTVTDSVAIDSASYSSFNYAYALDVIKYEKPTLVVQQYSDNFAYGAKNYVYEDKVTGFSDTIPLFTVDTLGQATYRFGYPCFISNALCTWEIKAYESYTNYDNAQNPVVTKQPYRYGIVNVSSNFGEQVKNTNALMDTTFTISNSKVVYASGNELMLDSTGTTYYSFLVGEPNTLPPYLSNVTINYRDPDRTTYYNWDENDNANVIVLGSKISGTNFVTKGPDQIFFILRDPIGSDSYAEWTSGQTIQKTVVKTDELVRSESVDAIASIGVELMEVVAPMGLGYILETKATTKIGPSESAEGSTQWTDSKTWEYTNSVTVATSQDNGHEMVGSPADLFIGSGTNRLYGNAQEVYVKRDTAGNYSIEDKAVLSVTTEFSTQFNYSQHYVEDFLIPNLEALRNQLLIPVTVSQYNKNYTNLLDSAVYITTLQPDDENYGEEGTYMVIWPQNINPADTPVYVNRVYDYNNQIRRWVDVLTHNERCKVMVHNSNRAFDREAWENVVYGSSNDVFTSINGPTIDSTYNDLLSKLENRYQGGWLIQNYSIGAGADLSVTESRNYTTISNGLTETDGFEVGIKGSNEVEIIGCGVEISYEAMIGGNFTRESSTEKSNSSEVSYHVTISTDEALTFDVYQAPDGFGPIFAARGGQTICPYQDEEVTEYYEPGSIIQEKTIPLGEPRITAQNPVATNVPSGKKAIYTVELANTATPDALVGFLLRQDPSTNQDGAVIKIDGKPLDETGTLFNLSGGDHYNKVIELTQTREDILDYDSIALIFHPDCFLYDADTIWISAHFVQTCSEIALKADKKILNNTTGNTVRFTIDGFEQDFRNMNYIQLQYQSEGEDQWHLVKQFPADSAATIFNSFSFTKPSFPDGTYRFRAVTLCQFGNETVNNESAPVTIIVDMQAPEALGLPYPIDGIYTANNQIYVDFNESIQTGRVLDGNVTVEGVLNAHEVNHSVSLNLENNTAVSNATYMLGSTPFTLEMWLNYTAPGTIFSYAAGTNSGMEFAIDASGHMTATINGTTYTSATTMIPNRWSFIVIQCDVVNKVLDATYSYDDQNVTLFYAQPFTQPASSGNIRFGGNGLNAKMHDVALWKRIRTTAESLAERSESKSPYTPDIMSLWRMDEGKGTVAKDDMRQRHLTLIDDAWAYSHVNYAMHVAAGDSAMVNISECPIEPGKCYLFEMWFRAAGNAELFHLADGSYAVSINSGNLVVDNHTLPMRNYQANTWHHLAIINPKISTPVIAIDGEQLSSASLRSLPGFASSHIILGDAANSNDIDIDEVRLWNINTTLQATKLQMGNCLKGDEDGLLAYYPMEAYYTDPVSSQISTIFTMADKTDADGTRVITHSDMANAQSVSVPALVESRPLEYVAHTHTTSDNRIVVNVTEPAQRIEGCWLEIMVKDIVDANGNYSAPIRWTVFVNRNQLIWDENTYTIVKDEIADTTINLVIVNNSSAVQNWNIDNIPSCMTLSETSGRINPLQTKTITCTIDATADRGETEYILNLSGNENMDCPLYITTKVYANKPDWNINPSWYEHSMNIIAYAEVDGVVADDSEDMMAAYVNGQLAGVAHLQLLPAMGRYYIMMTIFQNTPQNATTPRYVTFRYWDASTGLVYSSAQVYQTSNNGTTQTLLTKIAYQDNLVLGSTVDPLRIVMGNEVQQTIELGQGWNWVSFNVNPPSTSFSDILGAYVKKFSIIKSQTDYAVPDTATRTVRGSIGNMNCALGYKIKAYNSFDVNLQGMPASLNTAINLAGQKWTWFGYLPQKAMTTNSALSNINPAIGDIVKSLTQFATWDGYQWVGSLKVMRPGQSYIYRSYNTADMQFTYPDYADVPYLMPSMFQSTADYFNPVDPGDYQGNMNITATVTKDGNEVTTAEIGVFAGNTCHGAATYDDGYYFLTVSGDTCTPLTIKVLYNDSIYTLQGNLLYQNDAVVGSITAPFVIDLTTGQVPDVPSDPNDPYDPNNRENPGDNPGGENPGGDPGEDPHVSVVIVEAANGSKVEKVLIDNEVFIIKDGAMYDALGRRRK